MIHRPLAITQANKSMNLTKRQTQALWRCPACLRRFANRNQSHACGRYSLRPHFAKSSPGVVKLYRAFVAEVRRCGPVVVLPEKTRIAFQVRMSFAMVMLRRSKIVGHLVLARRHERPCFVRIDTISARNHVHHFVLERREDLRGELADWIRSAYAVGEQKHLSNHP